MRAIVIGGGFGGMASALRLRAQGYQVSLLERCESLGGRAQVFEREGFRHDAGPTVVTAPFLFDELFELFGERREDHLKFVPLTPWYRFRYADGDTFDYGGTLEDTQKEIARISPEDVQGYERLVEHSKKLYALGFDELAAKPFHRLGLMIKNLPALARLRGDRSVWDMVCKFLKHDKLRQAFSIQPLLVGGNPFNTTSIYALIHYLERAHGIHFAMGGTGAIVSALEGLLKRQGVDILTGHSVKQLRHQGRQITGVELESGQTMDADLVVFNGDPMHLYRHMLPEQSLPLSLKLKRQSKLSMGLYVLFFGTDAQYPDVAHHTIWLGKRYKGLLADIFDKKTLSEDFSLYVHRPTATDPSFAPPGKDSFYVLAPVPHQGGNINWAEEEPKLRARIVEALDQTMLPGLKENIRADFAMTPDDFAEDYLSHLGAGFSIAPLFTQSAWFRFHNRSEGFDNLLLAGAGTHPGAGMPGVLSSAKVVETLASEYAAQFQGQTA